MFLYSSLSLYSTVLFVSNAQSEQRNRTFSKATMPHWWCFEVKHHCLLNQASNLRSFTTDSASQLNVLGHDRNALSVDRAQVGVLKESHEVSLTSLLQSQNSTSLESKIRFEILSNLTNQALEWKLADQKLGTLLVSADLTKSNGTWAVTMRLLDTTSSRCTLASSLGSKLLAWSLTSSRLTSGLFRTSHCLEVVVGVDRKV